MDSLKLKNNLKPGQELLPEEVDKATGVLRYFDATFSSIRLYPPDNPAVKKSIDSLYERMREFLDELFPVSKIKDKTANQILIKFLSDKDGEVRTRAAMNLKYLGDKTTLDSIVQLAQEKDFKSRGKHEKKAILNFLASTKNGEVSALLGSILKKWSIFSMSKQNETRICAVSALETMATPEAVDIIMEGTKIRNRIIRQACKLALKKIAKKDKPNQTLTSEQSA